MPLVYYFPDSLHFVCENKKAANQFICRNLQKKIIAVIGLPCLQYVYMIL